MRRKDREITNIDEKLEIIDSCKVFRLGLSQNNMPYIVPLNFGYDYNNGELVLYFHCAKDGRKIDIIKENPDVCIEMDTGHELIEGTLDCEYGYGFKSIIGEGVCYIIDDEDEKILGLSRLMVHQVGGKERTHFPMLDRVIVCKVVVKSFTAKARI